MVSADARGVFFFCCRLLPPAARPALICFVPTDPSVKMCVCVCVRAHHPSYLHTTGLAQATVFSHDDFTLLASFTQEGLIRTHRPKL